MKRLVHAASCPNPCGDAGQCHTTPRIIATNGQPPPRWHCHRVCPAGREQPSPSGSPSTVPRIVRASWEAAGPSYRELGSSRCDDPRRRHRDARHAQQSVASSPRDHSHLEGKRHRQSRGDRDQPSTSPRESSRAGQRTDRVAPRTADRRFERCGEGPRFGAASRRLPCQPWLSERGAAADDQWIATLGLTWRADAATRSSTWRTRGQSSPRVDGLSSPTGREVGRRRARGPGTPRRSRARHVRRGRCDDRLGHWQGARHLAARCGKDRRTPRRSRLSDGNCVSDDRREKVAAVTPRAAEYLQSMRRARKAIDHELRAVVGEASFAALDRLVLELATDDDETLSVFLRRSRHAGALRHPED